MENFDLKKLKKELDSGEIQESTVEKIKKVYEMSLDKKPNEGDDTPTSLDEIVVDDLEFENPNKDEEKMLSEIAYYRSVNTDIEKVKFEIESLKKRVDKLNELSSTLLSELVNNYSEDEIKKYLS